MILPEPPTDLRFDRVTLRFVRVIPGDPSKELAPSYHFRIVVAGSPDVGHINFRIGDTAQVLEAAGHIGFSVFEGFRGNGFAFQACQAIRPLVRMHYESVILTCDLDNVASMRTIERLGATFIDIAPVPGDDPHYARGSQHKRRYRWVP